MAHLQELFAPYGSVQRAQLITDRDTGRSKGFGFVEMTTDQEAQAAIYMRAAPDEIRFYSSDLTDAFMPNLFHPLWPDAGLAVFLASAASDYCTGQTFPIDGGFTAGNPWPDPAGQVSNYK